LGKETRRRLTQIARMETESARTHLGSLNETERGVVTGIETGIENVTTEMTESVIETEVTGTGRAIAVMTVTVGALETMIMTETEGIDTDPVQTPREDDGITLALVHGHHLVIGGGLLLLL
jgi:hypothetical protein